MHRLSYVHTPMTKPYRYVTITDGLINNIETTKDNVVAIHREPGDYRRVLTKGELADTAQKLANYLLQRGIKKGENIGIFGPNTLEWIIGETAILLSGAVSVHLTMNTTDMEKNWNLISVANCKAILIDQGMKNEQENVITALLDKYKYSDTGVADDSTLPFIVFLRQISKYPKIPSLQNITREITTITKYLPKVYPEETAAILPTSGSTGEPKLIKLSHFAIVNGFGVFFEHEFIYNDRPFSWLGGYPIPTICMGGTLVFTDSSLALMSKSTMFILNILKEEKCQSALLLPYFLSDLLENLDEYIDDNWRIKNIFTGGQIVESNHAKVIGKFCDNLILGYGSSEAVVLAVCDPISDPKFFEKGNVGRPYAGVEIKIIDDDGYVVQRGQVGRIMCRSRLLFQGYYNRGDLTSDVFNPDGWFDTGDVGLINSKDEIVIKGRVKEIISRGTRKIVPSDIENVIMKIASVKEVSVVAVPDPRLLEEICVCFTSHDNTPISANDVEEFCKSHFVTGNAYDGLGDMPRYFLNFSILPLLTNGKIDKKTLKEQAIARLKL